MQPVVLPRLRLDKRAADLPSPYEITCVCGAVLRGQRQARAQTVKCPACQTERFILPRSPLPPIVQDQSAAPSVSPTDWLRRRWPWVVAATAVTLAIIVLTVILHEIIQSPPENENRQPQTAEERFATSRPAGESAFAEGSCQRAATELKEALDAADQLPGKLNAVERREIVQRQRQAAIVADLLSESLGEIVRHSAGTPEAEWQAVFARRYAGRSVILDDVLHTDAARKIHSTYRMPVPGGECKIDLKSLSLWKYADLSLPQRVLFGFRIAGLRRETPGNWTILPEPDSGVFLTDSQLFKALSISPDAEIQEVLKRQKIWIE